MKKNSKLAVALMGLFIFLSAGTTAHAAGDKVKIAFVDLRRALNETTEGKAAMKKLSGLKEKLQKRISAEEKKIMKMKETLEKQRDILTKETLEKKAEEYMRLVNELQQSYGKFQRELGAKEQELTQGILQKMQSIIVDIGRSDGYTMIYDRSSGAVVWAPAHLDLTDKLIQIYNGRYKGKKGKSKAKKKK
jgi:Skp family chaperone for outer membrane proteins